MVWSARPRLSHRLEHAGVVATRTLAGALPDGLRDRLAGGLGSATHALLRLRRGLAERQIAQAMPHLPPRQVERIARAAYRHLAREALTMLRLGALSPDDVRERTRLHGWDTFRDAVARERGVVLVTGHLGNWEIGGAALAVRGVPIDVVAQRQSNPLFDADVVAMRERLGMRVIERREAPRRVTRSLRQGRVVAFVADQDAKRAGLFVPFMGRLASTHRGPALFALRAGAPVFLGVALRAPDGSYDVRLQPVEADRSGEPDAAMHRLTAAFTAALEEQVRGAPEQYFWLHRRWKTRPRPGDAVGGHGTGDAGSRV